MKQSIERQIRNIQAEYPDAIIVRDEYTGTKLDRPGWQKIYKAAKPGDVIVFDSVSRMSRDAEEGFRVYEELFRRGVELIFLKEHHIDTATYKKAIDGQVQLAINSGNEAADELIGGITEAINRYLLALAKEQIRLAFDQAEKEVEDLHQRTREGIETARLNGKQIGQVKGAKLTTKKSIKSKEIIKTHSKDFGGTLSDIEVMKLTGLARGTFYKYKRELKESRLDPDSAGGVGYVVQHENGTATRVPYTEEDRIKDAVRSLIWSRDTRTQRTKKAYNAVANDPEFEQSLADDYHRVYEAQKAFEESNSMVDMTDRDKLADALIAKIRRKLKKK